MTLREIQTFVAEIDPDARHYYSDHKDEDYTVWYETERIGLNGDNTEAEEAWKFQIDRFTRDDDDLIAAELYDALRESDRIACRYLVDFELDTGYTHHIFECEGM